MRYFRSVIAESIASGLPGHDEQHVAEEPQRRLGVEQALRERDQRPLPPRPCRRGRRPAGGAGAPTPPKERPQGPAENPGGIVRMRGAHRKATARERRHELGAGEGALVEDAAAPSDLSIAPADPARPAPFTYGTETTSTPPGASTRCASARIASGPAGSCSITPSEI